MRALSCAISLQAAANSLFNILYAVCAPYWAAQLQANLGSPGLAKIFVDWEHPTGTRRGDVDGTVRKERERERESTGASHPHVGFYTLLTYRSARPKVLLPQRLWA